MNKWLEKLDTRHLEWFGIVLIMVLMAPILYLGEGCVFDFHDQLDETILSYVFAARYPHAAIYEQMMSGVPAEGLKPSAVLFVLLYRIFPVLTAFKIQYFIVLSCAFYGMYGCVKKLTDSSIVAFLCATAFAMLPSRPVYGLSVVGVPLCIFCMIKLKECFASKKRFPALIAPTLGILFFGFTSNLVLVGYALIIVFGIILIASLFMKRNNIGALAYTIALLGSVYTITNLDLIRQLFLGNSYVSHREEAVSYGVGFWESVLQMLKQGGSMHTISYHLFTFIPLIIACIILLFQWKKNDENKRYGKWMAAILIFMLADILQYSIFRSEAVVELKNGMSGMLKSFQFERFCWLMPAAWYILFGVSLAVIWKNIGKKSHIWATVIVTVLFLPTILYIARSSIFYQNVNQIRKGNDSGNMSWENIYSEDVMSEIEDHIGRDMSEYRVACLGMCPVVPLMHGFYTIDGYSNNYPIEYKHEFGEIIKEDIELNYQIDAYFNHWGSRAYLFHSNWGTYYLLSKKANVQVENLHFNFEKMREMGCEYLFSAAEITDAEKYDLTFEGSFESESSWWRVWVYKL